MEKIYEEAKKRIPSQKEQIFEALSKAGNKGVTNDKLNDICLRYSSSIFLLKLDGYDIDVENLGEGLVKYTLLNTPVKKVDYKKGIDIVQNEINANFGGSISTTDLLLLLDKYSLNIVRKPNGLNRKAVLEK